MPLPEVCYILSFTAVYLDLQIRLIECMITRQIKNTLVKIIFGNDLVDLNQAKMQPSAAANSKKKNIYIKVAF